MPPGIVILMAVVLRRHPQTGVTNCASGGDGAAELQGKLREAAAGARERHGCPGHHSHCCAASVASLVVWFRLPWQARTNIK